MFACETVSHKDAMNIHIRTWWNQEIVPLRVICLDYLKVRCVVPEPNRTAKSVNESLEPQDMKKKMTSWQSQEWTPHTKPSAVTSVCCDVRETCKCIWVSHTQQWSL